MWSILARALLSLIPLGATDTMVVCPVEWQETLRPWIAYREAQGHQIQVLPASLGPERIRRSVREAYPQGLKHLLLVGDASTNSATDSTASTAIPSFRLPAPVSSRWGGDKVLASDLPYADIDQDGVPDISMGRFPVDTSRELQRVIAKCLAYEQCRDFGSWRRRINLVAGEGGFGAWADQTIESLTRLLLSQAIPPANSLHFTYGNSRSPFSPFPPAFRETALERLNEGSIFWVYTGHATERMLAPVRYGGQHFPAFECSNISSLRCGDKPPIAIFLACSVGAFADPADCLAEELVKSEDGPAAAICGSTVAMPYGLAVLAKELMAEYFQHRPATVGEMLLRAKQAAAKAEEGDDTRQLLRSAARLFLGNSHDVDQELREHVQMFHLLGDPLLRFTYPAPCQLELKLSGENSSRVEVKGKTAVLGQGTLELVLPWNQRGQNDASREAGRPFETARRAFSRVYRAANDPCLQVHRFEAGTFNFSTQLAIPEKLQGDFWVRAFIEGANGFAVGAVPLALTGDK